MREHDQWAWTGDITVTVRNGLHVVERTSFRNLITSAGRNLMRDLLRAAVSDGAIKYVALGSGATAPAASDTQLATEEFRKAVTDRDTPGIGQVLTTLFVATTEANAFTTREIGWFAGSGATATVNSGVLVARVLYERAKTNLETIQIDRTDTLGA